MTADLFDDDRPLPAAVKRDLDRAAAGIGRVPTKAHPHCVCGEKYKTSCVSCGANYDAPCTPREWETFDEDRPEHFWARCTRWVPAAWCPQHRPEKP